MNSDAHSNDLEKARLPVKMQIAFYVAKSA